MKPLTLLPLLILTSEAARLVEEIILRDGDQREREERRFESEVGHEQEVIEVIIKEDLEIEGPTPSTVYKGLVPQLWPNYTGPIEPKAESVSCGEARAKCEFRDGCRFALQNYGLFCLDLVQGKTNVCSAHCRHALTALMSTHEGKRLMKCNCTGDAFCEQTKTNVGPCQDQVLHAASPDTVVSCTAAQWICSANSECSTALEYYNRNCQAMFRGKRCSDRCMNSINILKRQPSANKLETCFCDGTEDYDCLNIKANMETLCFDQSNEIEDRIKSGSNSIAQTIQKWMILFTVITGLIFNYIGATYYVMANSIIDDFSNDPPPPPTEIGVN